MRVITKGYMGVVSALGLLLGAGCTWYFFTHWQAGSLGRLLVLLGLYWVCCCLLLYIRPDCTVDLSFLSVLAAVMLLGPECAVFMNFAMYLFVIVPVAEGRGYYHALNTAPIKTLFNLSLRNLSYWLGGLAYYAAGGIPGDLTLPGVLLPGLCFIVVAMLSNVLLVIGYFLCERLAPFYPTVMQMFVGLLPSIALSAPIGYFLALLFTLPGGVWLAILFMLPLLLARYSFKLYLDSQKHQRHIVKTLTAALETKDTYTEGHSQRVEQYACLIAQRMNLPLKRMQALGLAAIFHDIGKIGVPDSILQKPGLLTPEERMIIQRHSQDGAHILQNLKGYESILHLVLHHHEFYDGRGYPSGTAGDDLPLDTYILGVADAYDAITSDRPYRSGRTPEESAAILRAEAGKQFHPQVALCAAEMAEGGLLSRAPLEV